MHKNFILKEERKLPEKNGTGRMYDHASGARVLHVQNDDENKVFNVMFRTPPGDDTGVPHILEHCVLNGSEKFPLKDPFFTMAKGSLNTFLNAMTYPDITMYPVASYNQKDFLNLVNVYLDAVYKPLVHKREESFLQEGWHYAMKDKDDELSINGVVYSEMKGAYSSPERQLASKLTEILFPQSAYRFSSGGLPSAIPNLTYEAFKDFHLTLYNPANSFVYLYGDMEIGPCFDLLDEYLSGAENRREAVEKAVNAPPQKPLAAPVFGTGEYSVSEQDNPAGKNYLGAYYATPAFPEPIDFFGYKVLSYILTSTPASPLSNTLLEKKIGESLQTYYTVPSNTPYYSLTVKNSGHDVQTLKKSVEEIIGGLVKDGLDKTFVEACLNTQEFLYREKDYGYPKGLAALLGNGNGWVYGVNPMDYFAPVEMLNTIRKRIQGGEPYFENLAKSLFLDNPFSAFVTLTAKPGLQAEDEAKLKKSLAEKKATFSPEKIDEIVSKKNRLDTWQNTPDTPEQLASIPILALSDIDKKAKPLLPEARTLGEAKALYLNAPADGISYNNFIFDIRSLHSPVEVPLVGMLTVLLSKLDTKKRSFAELTSEIKMHLGGFQTAFKARNHKDGTTFVPAFEVIAKALDKNAAKIYSLVAEILTETSFENKERIHMLLSERKAQMESEFINNGWGYAMKRGSAYLSQSAAYQDKVDGYGFYAYLKTIVDNFDSAFETFKENLYTVSRKIFNKGALTAGILCSEEILAASNGFMGGLYDALADALPTETLTLTPCTLNEAFIAETQVNYNALVFDCRGLPQSGVLNVLEGIINLEYLLQEIRVKGGAYGFRCHMPPHGVSLLASFRDPNLKRTYDVYNALPDFIENYKPTEREMVQYILGEINVLDKPKTASQQLETALYQHYTGMDAAGLQKQRDEILSANAAQIKAFAPMLAEKIKQAKYCAFGCESAVNENKGLFETVVKL